MCRIQQRNIFVSPPPLDTSSSRRTLLEGLGTDLKLSLPIPLTHLPSPRVDHPLAHRHSPALSYSGRTNSRHNNCDLVSSVGKIWSRGLKLGLF